MTIRRAEASKNGLFSSGDDSRAVVQPPNDSGKRPREGQRGIAGRSTPTKTYKPRIKRGQIPRVRKKFLAHLLKSAAVFESARKAGVNPRTVYRWKEQDKAFAAEWELAIEEYIQRLEEKTDRRAVQGIPKGIYYEGKRVAIEQTYSDALLMFRLKRFRPELYRDFVSGSLGLYPADQGLSAANDRARLARELPELPAPDPEDPGDPPDPEE